MDKLTFLNHFSVLINLICWIWFPPRILSDDIDSYWSDIFLYFFFNLSFKILKLFHELRKSFRGCFSRMITFLRQIWNCFFNNCAGLFVVFHVVAKEVWEFTSYSKSDRFVAVYSGWDVIGFLQFVNDMLFDFVEFFSSYALKNNNLSVIVAHSVKGECPVLLGSGLLQTLYLNFLDDGKTLLI